jgi:hypothetical protein
MLRDEAKSLSESGVHVVAKDEETRNLRYYARRESSIGLIRAGYQKLYLKFARKLFVDVISTNNTSIIISDENILGFRSKDMFQPPACERAFSNMRLLFRALPNDAELLVFLYVREPSSLHTSAWKMRTRKEPDLSYKDFLARNPDLTLPARTIERCMTEWGDYVRTVAMEEEIARGRFLGEQLLIAAGLPDYPTPHQSYWKNRSRNLLNS